MNTAALLTRGTVWLALACYVAAAVLQSRRILSATTSARFLWGAGCLLFLAHVAFAFHFYHHWSHTVAAEETRRQTKEVVGWDFGGGVYFNYLFAAIWLADCVGWIFEGGPFHERHRVWWWLLHGYFLFMIFNSTVVFGHGIARPVGAVLCAAVAAALLRNRCRRSASE
jgi:hypothetical protein